MRLLPYWIVFVGWMTGAASARDRIDEVDWLSFQKAFELASQTERWVLIYKEWPLCSTCQQFENETLLAERVQGIIAANFHPVLTWHPSWPREGVPPIEPALWEETQAWDPSVILWLVSPDRTVHEPIAYTEPGTGRPIGATRLEAELRRILEKHGSKLEEPSPPIREPTEEEAAALKAELLEMGKEDQAFRDYERIQKMPADEQQDFMRRGAEADRRHVARLEQIIAEFGWPTMSMVGEDAARAAFLIVQHADERPELQAACLPLLQEGAERGEVSRVELAYLTDRVRVKQGQPQLYGTQYGTEADPAGGFRYLLPIVEDLENLDARREAVGLDPWIEYERRMAKLQEREPQERPREAKRSSEDETKTTGQETGRR